MLLAAKGNTESRKFALPAILLMLLVATVLVLWYLSPYLTRRKGFGIYLPGQYQMHGIDVSHHQKSIDWRSVKSAAYSGKKIGFAFVKATEGVAMQDRQFRRNWQSLDHAGIPRGAYHFFRPDQDASTQAANYIRAVKLKTGDLPPVLDVEETGDFSSCQISEGALQWLKIIEDHYGVRPIVYSNVDFYQTHLSGTLNRYPLWVAHYHNFGRPRILRNWLFWQHSERGQVDGIDTKVDFNVFNGDSSDFARLLIPGN